MGGGGGGGLRTGCSGYQERLRQNREWLVGGLELGVVVTKSDCARTAIFTLLGSCPNVDVVAAMIYVLNLELMDNECY